MRLPLDNGKPSADGCLIKGRAGLADAAADPHHMLAVRVFDRGKETVCFRPLAHHVIEAEGRSRLQHIAIDELKRPADIIVAFLRGVFRNRGIDGRPQHVMLDQVVFPDLRLNRLRLQLDSSAFEQGDLPVQFIHDWTDIQGPAEHLVLKDEGITLGRIEGNQFRVLRRHFDPGLDLLHQGINHGSIAAGHGGIRFIGRLPQLKHRLIPLLFGAGMALHPRVVHDVSHIHAHAQHGRVDGGDRLVLIGQLHVPGIVPPADLALYGIHRLFGSHSRQIDPVHINPRAEQVFIGIHRITDGLVLRVSLYAVVSARSERGQQEEGQNDRQHLALFLLLLGRRRLRRIRHHEAPIGARGLHPALP